ncbi:hypothetical protein FHS16_003815 [Paenibacillus endophyticus]|uniref:Uncharacterized protein n=1 Tax=Paenibacillus endophyticus TaxID=1294268 RepID=A0A7W5C9T0_9BACL|nr:hypothetical protein [Paenibacillus endophyticus]MBB3153740.1 hypothetical protein [Paenibacillus endophyticus]
MKLLTYFTRTLLVITTLGAILLLALAFLFNDTGEPAIKLLAIWGIYPLIGLILFFVNELLLRKAFAKDSFRRAYGIFWACVAGVGCVWAIIAFF